MHKGPVRGQRTEVHNQAVQYRLHNIEHTTAADTV